MKFLTESAVWDILENLVLDGCLSIHFELVNRGDVFVGHPKEGLTWQINKQCEGYLVQIKEAGFEISFTFKKEGENYALDFVSQLVDALVLYTHPNAELRGDASKIEGWKVQLGCIVTRYEKFRKLLEEDLESRGVKVSIEQINMQVKAHAFRFSFSHKTIPTKTLFEHLKVFSRASSAYVKMLQDAEEVLQHAIKNVERLKESITHNRVSFPKVSHFAISGLLVSETEAWLNYASLHLDGEAGVFLVLKLDENALLPCLQYELSHIQHSLKVLSDVSEKAFSLLYMD